MLRDGLKILLKDALRSARDQLRRSGDGTLALPLPGARPLSRIADDVFSSIEATLVDLRYGSDRPGDLLARALEEVEALHRAPLEAAFEARFAAALYRLMRGLLALRGDDRTRLSERGIAAAGHGVRRALAGAPLATAPFAAEITLQLIAAHPLRGHIPVSSTAPDPILALAAGLALAAWIDRDGAAIALDCARSAVDIVVEARPRCEAALASRIPRDALAALYTELAPFAR